MKPRTIRENVYLIGAVDWDRRLFDALIPLPDGTSYNAYFVVGSEKNALIDTVDPAKGATLMAQLDELPAPDYLVIHHVEQDHSGCTPDCSWRGSRSSRSSATRRPRPCSSTTCTWTTRASRSVADGDTLSLGDKTLTFLFTPWVHWPETMSTWLEEDKILFSCDFFGSHYATNDVFADKHEVYDGAKRYYAEIMMPFGGQVLKNIDKVTQYPIEMIAPSHGPVYDDPGFIIEAYRDWAGGEPQNIVCLPFVSMHDSTLQDGRPPHRGAHRPRRRGRALRPHDAGRRRARQLAGPRRHDRARHADGAHRAASAGDVRGRARQRPAAARQVRDRHRLATAGPARRSRRWPA